MNVDPSRQPAVRCRGLVKQYPKVRAVDGLDLEVGRGECFGLLGPNGAGKTTTVEILEGLTKPDAGTVEILGERWGTRRDHQLRQRLGVQLQETELPEKLTVFEVVRLFRSFCTHGRGVEEAIDWVALQEKRNARVEKLSGGQKQRLALATALVGAPELLFLDEPTTGLDPQARLKIWELIERFLEGGGTVLLTTHYMEEAARLCHRVAIVDHGKSIALDTPQALIDALGAEQILEFRVSDGSNAPDPGMLETLPGVLTATPREGRFVLTLSDVGTALAALLERLRRDGVALEGLDTHQATLEDVFVHLTGRDLRDE